MAKHSDTRLNIFIVRRAKMEKKDGQCCKDCKYYSCTGIKCTDCEIYDEPYCGCLLQFYGAVCHNFINKNEGELK